MALTLGWGVVGCSGSTSSRTGLSTQRATAAPTSASKTGASASRSKTASGATGPATAPIGSSAFALTPVAGADRFAYAGVIPNSIAIYSIDDTTGALTLLSTATPTSDPLTFFAADPSRKFLVGTTGSGAGAIVSLAIDAATGALTVASQVAYPAGDTPTC